jgi:hypothetical protein
MMVFAPCIDHTSHLVRQNVVMRILSTLGTDFFKGSIPETGDPAARRFEQSIVIRPELAPQVAFNQVVMARPAVVLADVTVGLKTGAVVVGHHAMIRHPQPDMVAQIPESVIGDVNPRSAAGNHDPIPVTATSPDGVVDPIAGNQDVTRRCDKDATCSHISHVAVPDKSALTTGEMQIPGMFRRRSAGPLYMELLEADIACQFQFVHRGVFIDIDADFHIDKQRLALDGGNLYYLLKKAPGILRPIERTSNQSDDIPPL